MKKFIYTVLALVLVALVGCNNRAKDEVRVYPESAAAKAAALGTFEGEWTYVEVDTENEPKVCKGTVAFAECTVDSIKDQVAVIKAVCAELDLNNEGLVNVSHAGDDIIFSNAKDGGFGSAVRGRIYGAYTDHPSVTVDFQLEKKENRKQKIFNYSFK